jgi:hypothetical protein
MRKDRRLNLRFLTRPAIRFRDNALVGGATLLFTGTVFLHAQDPVSKAIEARTPVPVVIWHETVDVPQLNLIYGAGGKEDAPNPNAKYKFRKEDESGTSPKFDVEDDSGVRWRVKLGAEPRAETAATRLLFAAGYFVDEDYYIEELHVVGSREFNGLRVMMALVNNWDLKTVNNSIYQMEDQTEYVVTDVGATFGKTGNTASRSKSNLKDFEDSKFIDKVKEDHVDFVLHSRPLFITAFDVPNYQERTAMQAITKHIPRRDAKWLGQRLGQLTEEQIRDCFRAGGYTPEEVEGYSRVIQHRIAELNAL